MPQYTRNPAMDFDQLDADPLQQLLHWIEAARAADLYEPTAMTLATATRDGRPSARMVLFKGLHDGGLTFYTNYDSRKGTELAENPSVALCFWWDRLERQVRVEGRCERLPRAVSETYFHSRPRLSQLAAYTSRQSREVADRAALQQRLAENEARFNGAEVPLPDDWGGFRVEPVWFEFWQGQRGRFHDRLCYRRDGAGWAQLRLEP